MWRILLTLLCFASFANSLSIWETLPIVNDTEVSNITQGNSNRSSNKRATSEATYGHYCGLSHYNRYGAFPIDELDRACQLHDACVGGFGDLGLFDCYCSQQLQWFTMNINPGPNNVNNPLLAMKLTTLRAMSWADDGCDNMLHSFDKWFGLSSIMHYKQENYGFQYHVAVEGPKRYYFGTRNASYLELTLDQYKDFTNAIGNAHNFNELLNNLGNVTAEVVMPLIPYKLYVLNPAVPFGRLVVIFNTHTDANFFYYSNVLLPVATTYRPIYRHYSEDKVGYDIAMAERIMANIK